MRMEGFVRARVDGKMVDLKRGRLSQEDHQAYYRDRDRSDHHKTLDRKAPQACDPTLL